MSSQTAGLVNGIYLFQTHIPFLRDFRRPGMECNLIQAMYILRLIQQEFLNMSYMSIIVGIK